MKETGLRTPTESSRPSVARATVRLFFPLAVWAGLLFWAAGTLSWPRGWIHLGVWTVTAATNLLTLLRLNPASLDARMKKQRITQRFEKVMLPLFGLVTLTMPVVAGLDAVRFQWTSPPFWLMWPGLALHVAGDTFILWAMVANPFIEGIIRIQTERGHQVVTTGPYALVRHPMYLGFVLALSSIPLFLGSWWTFVPAGSLGLLLVIRTALEDRMLRRELPGYEDFARSTPRRLIPGIW